MTNLKLKTIAKSLPDSFRKTPVPENDFNTFFKAVKNLTNRIDNSNEREGNTEIAIRDFLKNAYSNYQIKDIRKKDDIDLVLFNDNSNTSPACLFEVKSPNNSNEFCQINDINKKALQQLIYYFIKERALNNNEIKYLIVTNSIQWFLFDASLINRLFYDDKQFRAECLKFQNNQMTNSTTGEAYKYIAEKIDKVLKDIEFTYFDFNTLIDFKDNKKNESDLTHFYKILSPQFIFKCI